MSLGIVGSKVGMTHIYAEDGAMIPVTVLSVSPNRVTQVKTLESDGYNAVQVTCGTKKLPLVDNKKSGKKKPSQVLSKQMVGHYAKAKVEAGRGLWEFRLDEANADLEPGSEVTVSIFSEGQIVDVTGTSKGKGFAGVIKRHNFSTQDATHGNSLSHRAPGSIGQNQTPGRVFKGKKMAGQMGNVRCTTHNLQVVSVDTERNLLLIKGAIPGCKNSDVIVRPAVKKEKVES